MIVIWYLNLCGIKEVQALLVVCNLKQVQDFVLNNQRITLINENTFAKVNIPCSCFTIPQLSLSLLFCQNYQLTNVCVAYLDHYLLTDIKILKISSRILLQKCKLVTRKCKGKYLSITYCFPVRIQPRGFSLILVMCVELKMHLIQCVPLQ